jgi:hypothetical protein
VGRLITSATWQAIVEIDRDIVEVCRMIDERGQDAPPLQRLGEMLDALMERKRALLEGRPLPPPDPWR